MKLKLVLAISVAAIVAPGLSAQTPAPAVSVAAETPHDRLFRLFKESDEDNLRRNPISALFRGDLRSADVARAFVSTRPFVAFRPPARAGAGEENHGLRDDGAGRRALR